MRITAFFFALLIADLGLAQDDVPFLTVTSSDQTNVIEFENPPSGPYELTRVIGRLDRYPLTPDDVDLSVLAFVVDVRGVQGKHSFVVHPGLDNGTTYFYTAFVNDGLGSWSAGVHVKGIPVDSTGPVQWSFYTGTGTAAMSPPGLGSVILVLANDGTLYPLVRGLGLINGGRWAPGALPLNTPLPTQHRPPVIPATGATDAANLTLIASQDGLVRGVDADTGALLWTSSAFGMLQGAPVGWFSAFSGSPENYVYVGSRNAGSKNALYALNASNGTTVWTFDDPGGDGIGIISGGAAVDYKNHAVYFASHEWLPGAGSVWGVDVLTGAKLWSTSIGNVSGSPTQRGEYLYVGTDTGLVYALNIHDGSVKLNFPFDTKDGIIKGFIFPNVVGDELYLSSQTKVWCLRDVEPVVIDQWSTTSIPGPSVPIYPPGRQFLWVGSSNGQLYQVDVTTGNPAQPPNATSVPLTPGGAGVGSPVVDLFYGLVYVGTEDGAVHAVKAPF